MTNPNLQNMATDAADISTHAMPDKEFLLAALRTATLRARLAANELDTVGIALKQGLCSYDDAVAWLRDENLLDHVLFRPELLHDSNTAEQQAASRL